MQKANTNTNIIEEEKQRILKNEEATKRLERIEAELLRRLQQTQQKEHEVFSILETAMNDSSKPKKDRYIQSKKSRSSFKI